MSKQTLKPGDKLAVQRSRRWSLITVEKITPTGRIVCDRFTLNPDWSIRGSHRWGPYHAVLPTDEIKEEIRRNELLDKIMRANWAWSLLTNDAIEKILSIIHHPESKRKL